MLFHGHGQNGRKFLQVGGGEEKVVQELGHVLGRFFPQVFVLAQGENFLLMLFDRLQGFLVR